MPILIYPLALLSALATLAICTPRTWWQRPTLLIASLLFASTCAYAQVWQSLLPRTPTVKPTVPATAVLSVAQAPSAPTIYRTKHSLNLRVAPSTNAKKQLLIHAQQLLISTGKQDGDWWQVRNCADAQQIGWVNSLWLRRLDESQLTPAQTTQLAKCEMRSR